MSVVSAKIGSCGYFRTEAHAGRHERGVDCTVNGARKRTAAKRHHTLPQFYLRGFADGELITTVRLPGDHRFTQSVRKAASENNFYTVPGHEDGDDAFEKALGSVENEAARIFADIDAGRWPLLPDDRMALSYFIALQAVRGPEQRRSMDYLAAQGARLEIGYGGKAKVKAWVKRHRGIDISDDEAETVWAQATQPDGPPIRHTSVAHIQQMAQLSDKLVKYLAMRPWTLVRFEQRALITSDVPVGLIRQPEDDPWRGVGFMTAWGVTYPMTRRLGLLMSDPMVFADFVPVERVWAGEFDTREAGTTSLERLFNQHTIGSASLYLYHHPADARFVPEELPEPTPVTMKMQGGPEEFSGEPMFGASREDSSAEEPR